MHDNANLSTSLMRGLAILSLFSEDRPLLGITDISNELDLNKSTVHRYVDTLRALKYLEQDEKTKKYRLGIRVVDLGIAVLSSMELRKVALPYLESLATEFGHTVNMAVLDHTEIVYVERVRTKKILGIELHVGSRLPAYCTSMGKVLLAFLPPAELRSVLAQIDLVPRGPNTIVQREALLSELERVREHGFALNNEELAYGLRSIAAPVNSVEGDVVAAINMALHTTMLSLDELEDAIVPKLIATANEISRKMGYRR